METDEDGRQPLRARTCGVVGPGETDRFEFDVREGNAFVLKLSGVDVNVQIGGCVEDSTLADAGRVRLKPARDCTIKLRVTTSAAEPRPYVIWRDK